MKIYSVSELIHEIKDRIIEAFPEVWLSGQISNLRVSAAGHSYFSLKDETSQVRAVLFRGSYLKFRLEDGLEVLACGRVSLYEPRGDLQLVLEHLEPKGVGALQLAFEQLKKKLEGEGLFDPARKRPLPLLPRKIGIVTSPTGSVIRDMIHILTRRFPNIQVLIYPVAVQGEGAAEQIAQGIMELDQRDDLDLIIIGRGGGSVEDLWAFNEEVVARAIAVSRHPLISAVGHETDFTMADFVADLRAPTPSAAAELAVPVKSDLLLNLAELQNRSQRALYQKLEQARLLLQQWRAYLRDPQRILVATVLKLDHLMMQLRSSLEHQMLLRQQRFKGATERLLLLNPRAILQRGYAVARLKSGGQAQFGKALLRAGVAKIGDSLEVILYEGELKTTVTGVKP